MTHTADTTDIATRPDGDGALPAEARRQLAQALGRLKGGNRLARAAGLMARFAGAAAAPLVRLGARAAATRGGSLPGGPAIQSAIEGVLRRAFDIAVIGMAETGRYATPNRARIAAIVSGAVGGAAGLPGFLPDAAFTTLLILRNIASIARAEGEDLASEDVRRACLEVFMFGSPVRTEPVAHSPGGSSTEYLDEDMSESEQGYWGARLVMQGAPLVKVIAEASSRLGVVMSEKLALQAIPIAGAAGGALVNTAFLDHYRALAQGHFTIRRLEREFGETTVRQEAVKLQQGDLGQPVT